MQYSSKILFALAASIDLAHAAPIGHTSSFGSMPSITEEVVQLEARSPTGLPVVKAVDKGSPIPNEPNVVVPTNAEIEKSEEPYMITNSIAIREAFTEAQRPGAYIYITLFIFMLYVTLVHKGIRC
jgi:hypothetical protein